MNFAGHILSARLWLTRLLVVLAIAGLLGASVAAVSPDWHARLHTTAGHCEHHHHDSDAPTHECAATLLALGLVDAATVPLPVGCFAGREVQLFLTSCVGFAATFPDRFPLGRAPPENFAKPGTLRSLRKRVEGLAHLADGPLVFHRQSTCKVSR